MTGLAPRLLWCAPAIFVIGVTALAASWTLFYIYHPDGFVGTLPSISETISTEPGSIVFQSLMCVVTPCIVVTWLLNFFASNANLATLAADGGNPTIGSALNAASCALGIVAGLLLAGLAAIRLHDGHLAHHWHIWLSEGFYSTQVISFLIDASCAITCPPRWQLRRGTNPFPARAAGSGTDRRQAWRWFFSISTSSATSSPIRGCHRRSM